MSHRQIEFAAIENYCGNRSTDRCVGKKVRRSSIGLILVLLPVLGCNWGGSLPNQRPIPQSEAEEDLPITFGGFIQNGPEDQKVDGQCKPNFARDLLSCDIHNGLIPWNITELTFQIIRDTDPENEHHYYRERVSIGPLQTETVVIKLGMQLPADTQTRLRGRKPVITDHWHWLVVGAKGTRLRQ